MNLREAAQQALEALEQIRTPLRINTALDAYDVSRAISALRTALAEPEQEPVAYVHRQGNHWEVSERFLCDDEKARGWTEAPLYTHPPQRKPLTDEEIDALPLPPSGTATVRDIVRLIERAHGIGGEA